MNGEFPRTESGRSYPVYGFRSKKNTQGFAKLSRKDLRNAVDLPKATQPKWEARSAYNRKPNPLPYGRDDGRENVTNPVLF